MYVYRELHIIKYSERSLATTKYVLRLTSGCAFNIMRYLSILMYRGRIELRVFLLSKARPPGVRFSLFFVSVQMQNKFGRKSREKKHNHLSMRSSSKNF